METEVKKTTGPRDVFSHLLSIIFLYVSVIGFGILLFGIIDVYFPDVLSDTYGWYAKSALRWPLALLVVTFPLYLWFTSYLERDLEKNPEKRALKIRKWLLYFTLFVATLVIVGDLVSVIFSFLNGELTLRFVLKVLTVLALALSVFVYYGWNVRKDVAASHDPRMKLFVRAVSALGFAAVIFGFVVAGLPQTARDREFDRRRVYDLEQIQSQVASFWQTKRRLPNSIDELRDEVLVVIPPRDPETNENYEYRTSDKLSFELCAVFKTSSKQEAGITQVKPMGLIATQESWMHDAGRACFLRTIDPERFPPKQPNLISI